MSKEVIKRQPMDIDKWDGDELDFEFEGNNCHTKYKKRENDDFKVEMSRSEFVLGGKPYKISVREVKDKRTGKTKVEWK
jgi:uncharacterized protein YxjI